MKKLFFGFLFLAALFCAVFGQITNAPAVTEMVILVNSSTNLNVTKVRITFQDAAFDPVTFAPKLVLNLEGWNDEGIVAKRSLALTSAQVKGWAGSTNPLVTVKSAILTRFALTERIAP